eukprot:3730152-Prymnesium_polylepis.1
MGARHDPRRNVGNPPGGAPGASATPPKGFVDGVDEDCSLCKSNPLSIGGGCSRQAPSQTLQTLRTSAALQECVWVAFVDVYG